MAKGIKAVQSALADPSREDEYNEWHSTIHIPEILSIPGSGSSPRRKATRSASIRRLW